MNRMIQLSPVHIGANHLITCFNEVVE